MEGGLERAVEQGEEEADGARSPARRQLQVGQIAGQGQGWGRG